MNKLMGSALALVLFAGVSSSAHAVTLASLLGGGTLVNGDKTFSNFNASITGDLAVTADNIAVTGVTDAGGNLGIRFAGPITVSGASKFGDFAFSFDVTPTSPNTIKDVKLRITASAIGAGSSDVLAETVTDNSTSTDYSLDAFKIVGGSTQLSDSLSSQGITLTSSSVSVAKDLALTTGSSDTAFASVSIIDQFFPQSNNVPEPGTVAMLVGMGVSGAGFLVRRRAKK